MSIMMEAALAAGGIRARDNIIILKNQEWNQIVSDISYIPRNKITSVALRCRLHGNEPGTSDTMTYYFDQLEVQKVEQDHFKGWNVAPGKISFSHTGYSSGTEKLAIASDLPESNFQLVNFNTGEIVLEKAVETVDNEFIGQFQIMNFSEIQDSGTYYIQASDRSSRNFRIGNDVWLNPLRKAVNFFYTERCGYAVPGVHDVCHVDWIAYRNSEKVSINGGWHDAGDLSQGLYNTAEATRSMFVLLENLKNQNLDPDFIERVQEEAIWGLSWLIKTGSAIAGQRPKWVVNGWYSNNIIGDFDDNRSRVSTGAYEFLTATIAEAVAYRVLKEIDPELAAKSLAMAIKDYNAALTRLDKDMGNQPSCQSAASAIVAAIELFEATGEKKYEDKALSLAYRVVGAQAKHYIEGEDGITGYLYYNHSTTGLLHSVTPGAREVGHLAALVRLCEAFPDHADWMKWYSGAVLYSEYFYNRIGDALYPYKLLPGGIYGVDEWKSTWESNRNFMKAMIEGGKPLNDDFVIRAFPFSTQDLVHHM
jgi:hypothetical protein